MAGECEPEKCKVAGWRPSRSHHRLRDPLNNVCAALEATGPSRMGFEVLMTTTLAFSEGWTRWSFKVPSELGCSVVLWATSHQCLSVRARGGLSKEVDVGSRRMWSREWNARKARGKVPLFFHNPIWMLFDIRISKNRCKQHRYWRNTQSQFSLVLSPWKILLMPHDPSWPSLSRGVSASLTY